MVVQKDPKVDRPSAGIMTHAKCKFGPLECSLSFSNGADGWRWREERKETAGEIEAANIARRECERRKNRETRRQAKRAARRARIEQEVRTYREENKGD